MHIINHMIAAALSRQSTPSVPAYLRAYNQEYARMILLGHRESFASCAAFSVAVRHLTVGGGR